MAGEEPNPIREPIDWFLGGVGAIWSVLTVLLFDPTGVVAALIGAAIAQAPTLFTLSGIGLAATGRVPFIDQFTSVLLALWIVSGVLFAAELIDNYWDSFKERLPK